MRRILILLCCVISSLSTLAQKDCRHSEYAEITKAAHPEISDKLNAVERFIHNHTGDRRTVLSGENSASPIPDLITIPVVVHILYNSNVQNISDAQILSQIDALNKDFRNKNSDKSKVPAYFGDIVADCGIEFKLANKDPQGKPTNGIVRRKTSIQFFGTDDRAKFTSRGGDDAWDANQYLNIWVCNLAGGVAGYSSLTGGPQDVDGVVITTNSFGISASNSAAFNKGRTATHEIGHWLNLRHIWGDSYCGDDKVDDTPSQRSPNRGCPSGKNMTCGTTTNGDMYMNFMDLTDDACMFMFTLGQRERMRALFDRGGPRHSLLSSTALSGPALPQDGSLLTEESSVSLISSINVYPNPVQSKLTIQLNQKVVSGNNQLVIYNHMGQSMQTCLINSKSNTLEVDVSRLANGIYFIRQAGSPTQQAVKFVKAR